MNVSECCFPIRRTDCCFSIQCRSDCCYDIKKYDCCFTVKDDQMAYMSAYNCCVPKKKCCIEQCEKREDEIEIITFRWHEVAGAECNEDGKIVMEGEWELQSVEHSISQSNGDPLPGLTTDPTVALKIDGTTPMDETYRHKYLSRIGIEGGVAGEKYRVTACGTLTNCDGFQKRICYCVNIYVEECC